MFGWCVKCDCNCRTCSSKFQCTSCNGPDFEFEIIDGKCYHDPQRKPEAIISNDLDEIIITVPKLDLYEPVAFIDTYEIPARRNLQDGPICYSLCNNPLFELNWNKETELENP